jgi:glyoxylase-like metal-dependent hydrolase (beta-lactamase superfamily II)
MERILGNSYFLPSQVVIGGYKVGDDLLLIDTGNDDSSVRKAIRDFEGINVKAIFNTHSHADHCGGNSYIQRQFDVITIAPELEHSFIEQPILEPTYLYGAFPLKTLHNKFLLAKPSQVKWIITTETEIKIDLNGESHLFTLLPLKGHSPNMYGLITPDGIAYLGDALISEAMIEKHPLIFTYNVGEHLKSIERLRNLEANGYVIAHGGVYDHIDHLCDANMEVLVRTQNLILNRLENSSCTIDEIHGFLFDAYNLSENVPQHLLNRSVVKAHLQYLVDLEKVIVQSKKGQLYFELSQGDDKVIKL